MKTAMAFVLGLLLCGGLVFGPELYKDWRHLRYSRLAWEQNQRAK